MSNVVSISNARKNLPRMIEEIEKNPETVFRITVRRETVAEIRSTRTMVKPGEAVQKLLSLRRKLSSKVKDQAKESISQRAKDHLYSPKQG